MNSDIIIVDNLLPEEYVNDIERIMFSCYFPWYYNDSSLTGIKDNEAISQTRKDLVKLKGVTDFPQFTHTFLSTDGTKSEGFYIVQAICDRIPKKINRLLRIKSNLNFRQGDTNLVGVPHTDIQGEKNYTTAVYYVNDSDGSTLIYTQKFEEKAVESVEILREVEPKKGRLVIFPGEYLHSSRTPLMYRSRSVINFNWI